MKNETINEESNEKKETTEEGKSTNKKELYESQRNYLTCAILMIIVGVLLVPLGEENWAIGCILVGVLFLIGFFVLLKKEGLRDVDEEFTKKGQKAAQKKQQTVEDEKDEEKDVVKEQEK